MVIHACDGFVTDWETVPSAGEVIPVARSIVDVVTERQSWQGSAIPEAVLQRYADIALTDAVVRLTKQGTFIAEIPGFDGVWSSDSSEDEVLADLREVLLGWLELKIEDGDRDIPVIDDDFDLNLL